MNAKKSRHSKLYDRMTDAMQLQSFAPKTQQSYLRAVRKLAEFYDKSPCYWSRHPGLLCTSSRQLSLISTCLPTPFSLDLGHLGRYPRSLH